MHLNSVTKGSQNDEGKVGQMKNKYIKHEKPSIKQYHCNCNCNYIALHTRNLTTRD
jgi:hypothetical protein